MFCVCCISNIKWLFLSSLYSGNRFCGLPRSLCFISVCRVWRHDLTCKQTSITSGWLSDLLDSGHYPDHRVLSSFPRFDDLWDLKVEQHLTGIQKADNPIHYVSLALWLTWFWSSRICFLIDWTSVKVDQHSTGIENRKSDNPIHHVWLAICRICPMDPHPAITVP